MSPPTGFRDRTFAARSRAGLPKDRTVTTLQGSAVLRGPVSGSPMRHEVVYTMARAVTDAEWAAATERVRRWWTRADGGALHLDAGELVVQCADSEDLRVECSGAITIWSARARSMASAQRLAGVLLCLQSVWSAEVIQLSGNVPTAFARAATALTPVWGGTYAVVELRPITVKADPLLFVDMGRHRRQLQAYYRTALELDETALPTTAFAETVLR